MFIANYKKYGANPSSHDIIKFIALIIMVIDHIGAYFFPDDFMWRAVGRIGFPIWFFLAGYARPQKIGWEIIILAFVLVAAKVSLHAPLFPINALFTVIICRLFVNMVSRYNFEKWQSVFYITGMCLLLPSILLFEYGSLALIFALFGYLVKTQPGSIDTKITAFLSALIFLLSQDFVYSEAFTKPGFSLFEDIVMYAGTLLVIFYLYNFSLKFFEINKYRLLVNIALFLSRNSLYFYVIHIVLFIIIARFIHPELYLGFKWI